jgi:hypothetical protein
MDPTSMFRDVPPAELRTVEGGLFGWLKDAFDWVVSHLGFSGTGMGGEPAAVVFYKGSWYGNP